VKNGTYILDTIACANNRGFARTAKQLLYDEHNRRWCHRLHHIFRLL